MKVIEKPNPSPTPHPSPRPEGLVVATSPRLQRPLHCSSRLDLVGWGARLDERNQLGVVIAPPLLRGLQRRLQLFVHCSAQHTHPRLELRPAEDRCEDLARVSVAVVALHAIATKRIVHCAALLVEERLVRLAQLLELRLLLGIVRVLVGVALPCSLVVGPLDLRRSRIWAEAEEVIEGRVDGLAQTHGWLSFHAGCAPCVRLCARSWRWGVKEHD